MHPFVRSIIASTRNPMQAALAAAVMLSSMLAVAMLFADYLGIVGLSRYGLNDFVVRGMVAVVFAALASAMADRFRWANRFPKAATAVGAVVAFPIAVALVALLDKYAGLELFQVDDALLAITGPAILGLGVIAIVFAVVVRMVMDGFRRAQSFPFAVRVVCNALLALLLTAALARVKFELPWQWTAEIAFAAASTSVVVQWSFRRRLRGR
jgi:hypothetical protein